MGQVSSEGLALVGLNVMLGTILAVRARTFNRDFLLAFLQTRILEQLLPVALLGLSAMGLDMPILLAFYGIGAAFMLFAVGGDVLRRWRTSGPAKNKTVKNAPHSFGREGRSCFSVTAASPAETYH